MKRLEMWLLCGNQSHRIEAKGEGSKARDQVNTWLLSACKNSLSPLTHISLCEFDKFLAAPQIALG